MLDIAYRPRLLNWLHAIHAAEPRSNTTSAERAALWWYARQRHNALEIGSAMGVSACAIIGGLAPQGLLTCVDPWPDAHGQVNPCLRIAKRSFARMGASHRVRLICSTSADAATRLGTYDFIFIDGDHSEEGITTDWAIATHHLMPGGIVCLHDVFGRPYGSARYFAATIAHDTRFTLLDRVDSMAVIQALPFLS